VDLADLDRLDPEDRAKALALLNDMGSEGPSDFIARTWPYQPPPAHTRIILEVLERARHERVRVCISMPPRHAKLVADSTPVFTPDGWRTHGDLKVGDMVFAVDGTPTQITYVSPRDEATLTVRFSDGEEIRVNPQHLWTVYVRGVSGYQTLETQELLARGLTSGTCRNGQPRARFMVDFAKPLQAPTMALPIDPYVFGLWLGDGSTGNGRITASPADAAMEMAEIKRRGYEIGAISQHRTTGCLTYCVLGMRVRAVVGMTKLIPDGYLFASEEQRRDLLRGLVDSDGSVGKEGRCRFVNTNRRLVDDVARLVATLGYPVTVQYRPPVPDRPYPFNNCKDHWCVAWTPTDGQQPALLPRKDIRHHAVVRRRSIVSITSCPPESGHCIMVDHPSHLYLVGERLVPTHNTTMISRGIAWWLKHTPADTCAYVSYSDHQAWSWSRKIRKAAKEGQVRLSSNEGVRASREAATVSEWRTIFGGGLLAAGAGGALTGQGVQGLLIVDDPYKNREKAESEAYRESVEDWFNEVVYTRMEGASVIVIHTRWLPEDLIGKLQKRGDWEIISLPAIAKENDALGRRQGEALWPERYPIRELENIRTQIGQWSFDALYQQDPKPRGLRLFNSVGWYDPDTTNLNGFTIFIGADPAASEKTKADHSAAFAIAIKGEHEKRVGYVLDELHGQWAVPEFAKRLRAFQQRFLNSSIAVEAVAGFKAVPQLLREMDPSLRVFEIHPTTDKFQRAQLAAAAWNTGRLLMPQKRQWTTPAVAEICDFTGVEGTPCDRVDALAHAWNVGLGVKKAQQGGSNLMTR
jgi:hypothetical protein